MDAIDGADSPFAVVYCGVVESAQADGIVHIGIPAEFPGAQVVDLTPSRDDRTPGGLAAPAASQDGAALGRGESPMRSALVEHAVVFIPDLPDDLTITG